MALAEMAMAGGIGLSVTLDAPADVRTDALLFGEAHSRVVVAVQDADATEKKLRELDVPFVRLGESGGDTVTVTAPARGLHLSVNLAALTLAYETPLVGILG